MKEIQLFSRQGRSDFRFWILWLLATTVAYSASFGVTSLVISALGVTMRTGVSFISPVLLVTSSVFGMAVGLAQYWVLRNRFTPGWWWVIATATGYGLAGGVSLTIERLALSGSTGILVASSLNGIVLGVLLGALQWPVLRTVTDHASLWIPGLALAYGVASAVSTAIGDALSPVLAVSLASAIAGGLLIWLLD
jgi:hypothetical protein